MSDFYDKVAKKFGVYHTPHKHTAEYLEGNPEKVFREKLLKLSGKGKIALDVGCADGRFTLLIASHFQKIMAIDLSAEMLKIAKQFQKENGIKNVRFEKQDASRFPYKDGYFDVIYNRRGPSFYQEFFRVLKHNSYYIEIGIGEKDTMELKMVFGRGQNFGNWDKSILGEDLKELTSLGFKILYAKNFHYNEYYASYNGLDLFLQGVPIFEDFDSEKDRKFLEEYIRSFQKEKGIKLPRHRIVIVARK